VRVRGACPLPSTRRLARTKDTRARVGGPPRPQQPPLPGQGEGGAAPDGRRMADASHTGRSGLSGSAAVNGSDKPCARVAFDSSAGEDPARDAGNAETRGASRQARGNWQTNWAHSLWTAGNGRDFKEPGEIEEEGQEEAGSPHAAWRHAETRAPRGLGGGRCHPETGLVLPRAAHLGLRHRRSGRSRRRRRPGHRPAFLRCRSREATPGSASLTTEAGPSTATATISRTSSGTPCPSSS